MTKAALAKRIKEIEAVDDAGLLMGYRFLPGRQPARIETEAAPASNKTGKKPRGRAATTSRSTRSR